MSWESDFETQWRTFINVVQTRVRRACVARGRCDAAAVSAVIASERSKWASSNHHHGAWLRELKREHQQIAHALECALNAFRVDAPLRLPASKPLSWVLFLLGVASSAATFTLLWTWGYPWWKQLLSAGIVAALVLPVLARRLVKRGQKQVDAFIGELRASLEREGSRLRGIVARADAADQAAGGSRAS
jgi:hypothetical protein